MKVARYYHTHRTNSSSSSSSRCLTRLLLLLRINSIHHASCTYIYMYHMYNSQIISLQIRLFSLGVLRLYPPPNTQLLLAADDDDAVSSFGEKNQTEKRRKKHKIQDHRTEQHSFLTSHLQRKRESETWNENIFICC